MIAVEGLTSVLYNLAGDPDETQPYSEEARIGALAKELDAYLDLAATRRKGLLNRKISLKDEIIQQRLRDLGYLE
jgi:hypothetical protein